MYLKCICAPTARMVVTDRSACAFPRASRGSRVSRAVTRVWRVRLRARYASLHRDLRGRELSRSKLHRMCPFCATDNERGSLRSKAVAIIISTIIVIERRTSDIQRPDVPSTSESHEKHFQCLGCNERQPGQPSYMSSGYLQDLERL